MSGLSERRDRSAIYRQSQRLVLVMGVQLIEISRRMFPVAH